MVDSKNLHIANYHKFYIQASTDASAVDTRATFGMIAKVNPFPLLPNAKAPYKNDWLDENGDEEYVASMHYEAIEFSVGFFVRTVGTTSAKTIHTWVDSFFSKVKQGYFKTFDESTGIGFQNVRYVGYKEDSFLEGGKGSDHFTQSVFTITFKANDPVTRMKLYNGSIVTE